MNNERVKSQQHQKTAITESNQISGMTRTVLFVATILQHQIHVRIASLKTNLSPDKSKSVNTNPKRTNPKLSSQKVDSNPDSEN